MNYIKEILPGDKLKAFQDESDRLAAKLKSLTGTWLDKPVLRKLVMWYYSKQFLRAVKRLTNGV